MTAPLSVLERSALERPTSEMATNAVAFDFTAIFAALRASVIQQLLVIWYGLQEYSDATLQEFLDIIIPIILAAEETSASSTFAYIGLQFEILGRDPNLGLPSLVDVTGPPIRGGVPMEEVYSRPFKELWTALANGYTFDQARDMGAMRLRQLAETDLQLSHTHSSRSVLSQRNDVVGFRRVPTGDFTCALCLIASTQRYRKFDLLPIHPGCDCRVAPIISDEPVGQILDQELLDSIHAAVENMFGSFDRSGRLNDYRKLIVVNDHGEYGPTLGKSGNRFTRI